jgi:SAM-dependent methyltransferase
VTDSTRTDVERVEASNAEFWNELCGSTLARSLGIEEITPETLRRFDDAYLAYYPYLASYLDEPVAGRRVLEIGLGFGTLGQQLAERGAFYHGLDIAERPVAMMQERLRLAGLSGAERVRRGSALELPYEAGSFDYVWSIGCLHHTGDLPRSVSEVHRVLAPGGRAVVMLYNRHSLRQVAQRLRAGLRRPRGGLERRLRSLYDTNTEGEAAPHTDFVSRREARRLFREFARVRIDTRNFDAYSFGRLRLPRQRLLGNLGRFVGLDLYIVADKASAGR